VITQNNSSRLYKPKCNTIEQFDSVINMKIVFVLLLSLIFVECAFDENRRVEKLIKGGVLEFHQKMNNERFNEIYADSDEELKRQFSEEVFVMQLREAQAFVFIKDELVDGAKRTVGFQREKFTHVELINDESQRKATEHFEWKVKDDQVKLVSYELKMICETPCVLTIKTK
jgi:hypothetical protein